MDTTGSDGDVQAEALIIKVQYLLHPVRGNSENTGGNRCGNGYGSHGYCNKLAKGEGNNYYWNDDVGLICRPLHTLVHMQPCIQPLRLTESGAKVWTVMRLRVPPGIPPSVRRARQSQQPRQPEQSEDLNEASLSAIASSSTQSNDQGQNSCDVQANGSSETNHQTKADSGGLFKNLNKFSLNPRLGLGSFATRSKAREKRVIICLRDRFPLTELNHPWNAVILYFNIGVETLQPVEETIKHVWLPQIKHHSPQATIILAGQKRGTPSGTNMVDSGYSIPVREDGIRLAQKIGAVAYVEISPAMPYEDPGIEELVDILAWSACKSKR